MGGGTTSTMPPTTTSTLAPSTSSGPTCELEKNLRDCVAQGGSFECERCNDSTGDPETTTKAITTTTSSQAAGECKKWCASNPKSWEKKCRWVKCAGCSPCFARRLRGSDIVLL